MRFSRTAADLAELLVQAASEALANIRTAETDGLLRLNEYVPTDRLLTLKEAATYLGFSARWLDNSTRQDKAPVVPFLIIGGAKRFRKASLDRELESREIKRPKVKL